MTARAGRPVCPPSDAFTPPLAAPAGLASLGAAPRKARLPGCAGCIASVPSVRSSFGASPSSLDAPTSIPSGWTFASRKRQPGSRASLGAGGFAPRQLSGRWGGPALGRRDAPAGQPCGPAAPSLPGATLSAPPSTRPWAGWACGRLPAAPLRGSPEVARDTPPSTQDSHDDLMVFSSCPIDCRRDFNPTDRKPEVYPQTRFPVTLAKRIFSPDSIDAYQR